MENKFKEVKVKDVLKAVLAVVLVGGLAVGSDADFLIQKLVEKGVITGGEGAQIMSETDENVAKNLASGKSSSVPGWVQVLTLKGDVRYRLQEERSMEPDAVQRIRERLRLRLNGFADIGSGFLLGLGICSGTDDPRSTNQTLENSFQHPDIRLDMAWGQYLPVDGLTLLAGKFPYGSFLYKPSDLLFDSDLNFEGVAADYKAPLVSDLIDVFAAAGYLNIDENSSSIADPGLVSLQAGVKIKAASNIYVKAAMGLHLFENVQGMPISNLPSTGGAGASNTLVTSTSTTYTTVTTLTNTTAIGRTQTTTTTSKFAFDYDCGAASLEMGVSDTVFPVISVFVEAVINMNTDTALLNDAKNGYIVGLKFGDAKVDELGKWQAMISSRMLQKDAWVDFLSDSDAYGGKTAMIAHELKITYGFTKNANFEFDYYYGRKFPVSDFKTDTQVAQFDFNFKF
ncbi:MAG: putative porin [Candidatus Firestonebacteria bacterium]